MSKELDNVNRQIARLEEITRVKSHGAGGGQRDPKVLGKLSELYRKRQSLVQQTPPST